MSQKGYTKEERRHVNHTIPRGSHAHKVRPQTSEEWSRSFFLQYQPETNKRKKDRKKGRAWLHLGNNASSTTSHELVDEPYMKLCIQNKKKTNPYLYLWLEKHSGGQSTRAWKSHCLHFKERFFALQVTSKHREITGMNFDFRSDFSWWWWSAKINKASHNFLHELWVWTSWGSLWCQHWNRKQVWRWPGLNMTWMWPAGAVLPSDFKVHGCPLTHQTSE